MVIKSSNGLSKGKSFSSFLLNRWGFVIIFILSGCIFLLSNFNLLPNDKIKLWVSSIYNDSLAVFSKPINVFNATWENIGEYYALDDINQKLENENAHLVQWKNTAFKLYYENERLKEILGYHPSDNIERIVGRVIINMQRSFANSFWIKIDKEQKIILNSVVAAKNGIVGRVIDTKGKFAHIISIRDINSKIPILIPRIGVRGMLSGRNDADPQLDFLSSPEKVKLGDRVVTAHDGFFSVPDLLVGYVTKISSHGIELRPAADMNNIDYVQILQSSQNGLKIQQEEDLLDDISDIEIGE